MPGARPAALGGAFTAVTDDALAVYYNPAGLGFLDKFQVLFTHTELFSLSDLRYEGAYFSVPINKKISIGASYSQFGPDMYKEIETLLGASFTILPQASLGISVTMMDLRIEDYGSAFDWAGSVGFLGRVHEVVWVGMQTRNVFSTHVGRTDEMPEKSISFGALIIPRDFLNTFIDIEREQNAQEITYRLGQEVNLLKTMIVRFGFHNYPDRVSGGFGLEWKGMRFDYAVITHQHLGLQHQFSFLVSW